MRLHVVGMVLTLLAGAACTPRPSPTGGEGDDAGISTTGDAGSSGMPGSDGGLRDGGASDAAVRDAATRDAAELDAGGDAGQPGDAGARDAAVPDAMVSDAAIADAANLDASVVDAASATDAATGLPDAFVPDASSNVGTPDPDEPDNALLDSDCDGLSDAEEFGIVWASGARTDPGDADSDGDGLRDGLEAGRTSSVDLRCIGIFVADRDVTTTTDPTDVDSDGDGLADGSEDADHNGERDRDTETDPRNPDSDGDGACDGPLNVAPVCTAGDTAPLVPGSDSDSDGVPDDVDLAPNNPDGDGDGLCDGPVSVTGACSGGEDLNGNGRVEIGETDPSRVDTDCDGLVDGQTLGTQPGEANHGTDPRNADSDGDGLLDGLEVGVESSLDPDCVLFAGDTDPTTVTDPRSSDSDGDTLLDGAEDANHNGAVDANELDPRNGADGTAELPVVQACGGDNLVRVELHGSAQADLRVASAIRANEGFDEKTVVTLSDATTTRDVGLMAFHPGHAVAYLAINKTPAGNDALAEEAAGQALLDTVGTLATPITYRFTTWDGYDAVHATYDMAGTFGVKEQANAIVQALVPGAQNMLALTGDVAGPSFKLVAEYVRRSANTAVVLIGVQPSDRHAGDAMFTLGDIADGASLAQYSDSTALQCERFSTSDFKPVDIMWAIDNSASMANSQAALAASASAMATRLGNASIDWRVSVVTSGFYSPPTTNDARCTNTSCADDYFHQCRYFTSDINRFSGWLTSGNSTWIGAGGQGRPSGAGSCNQAKERIVRSAQLLLSDPAVGTRETFMPPTPAVDQTRTREGSHFVLLLMGDADDQYLYASGETLAQVTRVIDDYETFLRALPFASITLGGVLCPDGLRCNNELQRTPRVAIGLINRFGGVLGSLQDVASIAPTVDAIIDSVVANASPYVVSRPAISATLKVAMESGSTVGACQWGNVPRSRENGFDYDPRTKTVAFFGDCRPDPNQPGRRVAVSYRYWVDQTPDPDPPPVPCSLCDSCPGLSLCDQQACACTCDQTLSCNAGFRWDSTACDCVCDTASLTCDSTHQPDEALCACVCKPNCGRCPTEQWCNNSTCVCSPT